MPRPFAATLHPRHPLCIDLGLLLARLGFAYPLFAMHGLGKMELLATGQWQGFPDPIGLGPAMGLALTAVAEGICTILVMLGLVTRLAALPPLAVMTVALLVVHADDPWAACEAAVLYWVGFAVILVAGPGSLSVDGRLWYRRGEVVEPPLLPSTAADTDPAPGPDRPQDDPRR